MKKFVSVLLALAMVLMMTTAFATGSRGSSDIPSADVTTETEEAAITIEIVEDTEAIAAVKTALAAAIQAADLSAVIPAEVLELIPEDFRNAENLADNVKEMVAISVEGEVGDADTFTMTLSLDTPYEDGEEVYVAFALMDGETVAEWIVKPGTVKEGAVQVELTAEGMTKMVGNTFAAIVFSK